MKKPFAKQIILGTMALTLFGGGGYLLKGQDALAATATTTNTTQAVSPQQDNHAINMVRKVNDELIAFLKLEKSVYQEKITSGKTLAEIAAEQGISRDALKAKLTKEVTADLDQEKADFALNLDKTVDSTQLGDMGRGGSGYGHDGKGGPGERGGKNRPTPNGQNL